MKRREGDGDFDRWLERELQRTVATAQGPSPRAAQAAYRAASRQGGGLLAIKSALIAALGARGLAGLGVAALAIGGGSVAAAAATGSANPTTWGHQVVQAVEACKDKAAAGDSHGIGQCVSAFARQHGQSQREESKDSDNDNDNDNDENDNDSDDQNHAHPSPAAGDREDGNKQGSQGPSPGHGSNGNQGDKNGQGQNGQDHGHPTASPRAASEGG